MPYLYGLADTKFIKKDWPKKSTQRKQPAIKFRRHTFLAGPKYYNKNDVPILFKTTPNTLLELCVNVIDKLPISSVYDWGEVEVMRWLIRYGYPQYRNTFRVNFIFGRKLLLTDASALAAMNIKDFEHIRQLTRGIRELYNYELAKKQFEVFKLFRTRSGMNYDEIRRSDLWRAMQLIREKPQNIQHWELLEMWLKRVPVQRYVELRAFTPRDQLYRCAAAPPEKITPTLTEAAICTCCIPPCDCNWTDQDICLPTRLSALGMIPASLRTKSIFIENTCKSCIPPCECTWPSRYYLTGTVIKCLQQIFPEKFCPMFDERMQADVRPSVVERWTRFSI